jgi:tetratricopeptide (TPR) repeat protein
VGAFTELGWCKISTGSIEEAIALVEQAIRLSLRDPTIGWWYLQIGTVHLLQSRIDEAILWLEKARAAIPAAAVARCRLAAAYALRGDSERAAEELTATRRLAGVDVWSLTRLKAGGRWGVPKTRALWEATFFAGLRKAGMPEE